MPLVSLTTRVMTNARKSDFILIDVALKAKKNNIKRRTKMETNRWNDIQLPNPDHLYIKSTLPCLIAPVKQIGGYLKDASAPLDASMLTCRDVARFLSTLDDCPFLNYSQVLKNKRTKV